MIVTEIDRTIGELSPEAQANLNAIGRGFGKMCSDVHKDFNMQLVTSGCATMHPHDCDDFHEMRLTARGKQACDRLNELSCIDSYC